MGFGYFVVLLSLFSGFTLGEQVTGFSESSVTKFPETKVTGFPETTITGSPETAVTGFPETAVTGFPETPLTGISETTVTGLSETTVTGLSETTVTGLFETSVNGFHETTVTGFSELSVTYFPETTTTGSPETTVTWIDAALHCYNHHTILENNITILTDYINASYSIESVWVGSFIAWLPWIEMRGCYNISADMDTVTDIPNVDDPALCQVKCTKTWRTSSQYFGFNQHDHRCVCLEHERFVNKSSENSSLCSNCMAANACHEFVDVYKGLVDCKYPNFPPAHIVNESFDEDQTNEPKFCLARNCSTETPNYSKSKCDSYFKAYCRNKMEATSGGLTFQTLVANCKVRHSTYPLLYSDIICNKAKPGDTNVMYWVGVYRQKLYLTILDKLDLTDFKNSHSYIRKFAYLSQYNTHTEFGNRSTKLSFVCKSVDEPSTTDHISTVLTFVSAESYEESTSRPTTSFSKDTGMIVGIVLSISVMILTMLVILAFMYRRTYTKEQLSLNTAARKDRSTSDMDNNTVISDYQQLDNVDDVQKMTQAYDQLHVPCYQTTNDQANTSFSRQEYSEYECIVESNGIDTNTVISEYEELYKADKDTSTRPYDQLNVTRVVKTEPTSFFFKTNVSSEKHSKNESTKATTVTIEYEQLNYAKKDKSVNVYDQLNVTDIIDTDPTNYNSKTTISRDQESKDEPTEETTELNNVTVTSEYEQLDNAKKDKSVNVYDQIMAQT